MGVPPLLHQGIKKGMKLGGTGFALMTPEQRKASRKNDPMQQSSSKSKLRKQQTAGVATIPPELSSCVADYAERLCEVTA